MWPFSKKYAPLAMDDYEFREDCLVVKGRIILKYAGIIDIRSHSYCCTYNEYVCIAYPGGSVNLYLPGEADSLRSKIIASVEIFKTKEKQMLKDKENNGIILDIKLSEKYSDRYSWSRLTVMKRGDLYCLKLVPRNSTGCSQAHTDAFCRAHDTMDISEASLIRGLKDAFETEGVDTWGVSIHVNSKTVTVNGQLVEHFGYHTFSEGLEIFGREINNKIIAEEENLQVLLDIKIPEKYRVRRGASRIMILKCGDGYIHIASEPHILRGCQEMMALALRKKQLFGQKVMDAAEVVTLFRDHYWDLSSIVLFDTALNPYERHGVYDGAFERPTLVRRYFSLSDALKDYSGRVNELFKKEAEEDELKAKASAAKTLKVILDITLPEKYREHFGWRHFVVFKNDAGYLWCSRRVETENAVTYLRDFMISEIEADNVGVETEQELFMTLRRKFKTERYALYALELDATGINNELDDINFDRRNNQVEDPALLINSKTYTFQTFDAGLKFFGERVMDFFAREAAEEIKSKKIDSVREAIRKSREEAFTFASTANFYSHISDIPSMTTDRLKSAVDALRTRAFKEMLSFRDSSGDLVYYSANSGFHYEKQDLDDRTFTISINGNDYYVHLDQFKKIHADLNLKWQE